jgi:PTS system nitrogen regulatory IIA component
MDLKIKDVAELLKVSEKTIRRWLQHGKIPAYRLNHQYRFSRMEIQDWVMAQKLRAQAGPLPSDDPSHVSPKEETGHHVFSLLRAITRGGIHHGVPGLNKDEIIHSTMRRLEERLDLDGDRVAQLLLEREALMPTALNNGLAVPHTRDFLLKGEEDAIAVVFPEQAVPYGALDHQPVHCLFFLFAHTDKQHLRLLARLAHFVSRPEVLQKLEAGPSAKELLELVRAWEAQQMHLQAEQQPV